MDGSADMALAFLAAASRPPAELLVVPGGRVPVALPVEGPFDAALPRLGWVALLIGRHTVAIPDGPVPEPLILPDAWRMGPAASPELAVLDRCHGTSREEDEPMQLVAVDARGTVVRELETHNGALIGELSDGRLVLADALLTWGGSMQPLPVPGRVAAVVGGRLALVSAGQELHLCDLLGSWSQFRSSLHVPGGLGRTVVYDSLARCAAIVGEDGVVVATADHLLSLLDVGFRPWEAVWLDAERLLLWDDNQGLVIDVRTGDRHVLKDLPARSQPMVAVTGRFDLDRILRRAGRPPRQPEVRRTAVPPPGGLRVRTFPATEQPSLGSSRLGGCPDLPQGRRWPRLDGRPLMFLAQLNLGDLADLATVPGLPTEGLLSVFVDLDPESDDPRAVRVEIVRTERLHRCDWPSDLELELRSDPAVIVIDSDGDGTQAGDPHHQLFGQAPLTAPPGLELLLRLDEDAITGWRFADGGSLLTWWPTDHPREGLINGCEIDLMSS